jgi:hypothetical protein
MASENEKKAYDPEAIMLAIGDLKSILLRELKGKDPLWWRIIQLILPIMLTAILGFIIWKFQSSIQENIDEKASLWHAQIGLVQHLYEQRLVAYKELYDKALAIYRSLQEVKTNGPQAQSEKDNLHNNLMILSELRAANKIIASQELNTFLFQTWYDTIKGQSSESAEELMKKVEDQMRKDLFVDKLGPEQILKSGK